MPALRAFLAPVVALVSATVPLNDIPAVSSKVDPTQELLKISKHAAVAKEVVKEVVFISKW